MIAFLKKFPWWFWVGIFLFLFFLWQNLSGWAYSNKLWKIAKEQIVSDESRIIEELEQQNLIDQKEKEDLYRQVDTLKKQRASLTKEKDALIKRIQEIQYAMENVSVPNNPDELVNLLRSLGLRSVQRRPK